MNWETLSRISHFHHRLQYWTQAGPMSQRLIFHLREASRVLVAMVNIHSYAQNLKDVYSECPRAGGIAMASHLSSKFTAETRKAGRKSIQNIRKGGSTQHFCF